MEIGTPLTSFRLKREHLHGKFFKDRAEFYIIEHPGLFLSNKEVSILTLYFLDGVLCKKKFTLENDIGPELIKTYGSFSFLALNKKTKYLAREEPILISEGGKRIISQKLIRYRLKWQQGDITLKYRVFKDTTEASFTLSEELTAYQQVLRTAERTL